MCCLRFVCGWVFLCSIFVPGLGTCWAQDDGEFESPPNTQELGIPMTPPAEALKMMELPNGFHSTLFAAEPDVHQPIAATMDSRGRLWVAECYTYSDGAENYNTQLNDRIVIFEDVDNDGVFDKKKVFWDQAKKLTSLEVGFGGVWVTAAPNLMFIPDADQNDIPDGEPIILLDGFEGDVIRHNIVNGLRWGPDGWLYGRHGIQATSFVGPPGATESQRVAMNCAIWRFHPVHRTFEIVAQGGTNPWGFDFDEHGEMFMINTVIGHLFHVVPNARYRRMYGAHFNPHLYQVIEQTADHFHWDVSEEHWAVTKKEGMSDGTDLAGGGHAHTGLMIYQGGNWPKEFHNKLFTANFHGRRINSDSIHRVGNSYVAHHGPDYFRTQDPWFRGIELVPGPDGGVYVLDWSDIGECHENDGIHRTSGRVFKITYGKTELPTGLNLSDLSDQELIGLLSHNNEWYVRKARRLLQQRAVELTEMQSEIATNELQLGKDGLNSGEMGLEILSKELRSAYRASSTTKSRLRILWAYYSCGLDIDKAELNQEQWLIQRLAESDEHLRAWAVRLLADGINLPSTQVAERFIQLAANDPSGLVRLYIASSLPRFEPDVALKIASALAVHASDADDRVQPSLIWYGIEPMVTSRIAESINLALQTRIPLLRRNIARRLTVEMELTPDAVAQVVQQLGHCRASHARDLLIGMTEALNGWNRAVPPENWASVSQRLAKLDDPEISRHVQNLNLVFGDGRALSDLKILANDEKQDIATRRQAIATLAKSGDAGDLFDFFKSHLNNKALTTEIIQALVRCDQPDAAKLILNRYPHLDPEGQSVAIDTLVARKSWAQELLVAVAAGRVPKAAITASHARQINNFGDQQLQQQLAANWGTIRQTATELVAEMSRLRDHLSPETLKLGDLEKGRDLYEKTCANCHTLFGRGGRIGPDLTGSDRKNLNYLLENVVDPSASVAQGYQTSVIALDDGRFLTGVIVEENDRTLMLQTKDEVVAIDLKTIDERKKTSNSLMPIGLMDQMSDQEVANLFRFLAQ